MDNNKVNSIKIFEEKIEDLKLQIQKEKQDSITKFREENSDYLNNVKTLAENTSNYIFDNSNITHASIVISAIMKYTNNEFRIYDADLSGNIADRNPEFEPLLLDLLGKVIKKNGSVKILVDNGNQHKSGIYQKLSILNDWCQEFGDKKYLEVRKINGEKPFPLHFAVGDNSYRMERSDNINKDSHQALCCFNDFKKATALKLAFDRVFENAEPFFK